MTMRWVMPRGWWNLWKNLLNVPGMMNKVYVSLGGNLGDRDQNLLKAKGLLEKRIGAITGCSSIYETEPWGFKSTDMFLNQVLIIETDQDPQSLLINILEIEDLLGRKRSIDGYSSRPMDIDILFYQDKVIRDKHLQVPHPRLHKRMFNLLPLNEVDGSFIHPVFNKSVGQLLQECPDKMKVSMYKAQ